MISRTVIAAALSVVTATAFANNTVGLSVFGIDSDTDRLTEEGIGLRANFGWGKHAHLKWEAQFAQTSLETGVGAGTDFYQSYAGIDGSWRFAEATQWQPYVLAGLGLVYDDVAPDSADDINVFVNLGLGLLTPPLGSNNIRLRFDARYVHDEFGDGVQDIHYGAGVEIPLWQERVVERIVEVEKVVYRDVPVAPVAVDSDADGVVDQADRCPATLRGSRVDASGCVIQAQVIVLNGIQFASDSASMLPDSINQLNAVAQAMLSQTNMRVEIAGHTDASGGFAHNKVLSERRAQAVRAQLINRGVASHRLEARGYGESNPIAGNQTVEGRAQNRRVEFRVLGH